jgi:acetyl esterase/lipase
MTDRTHSKAPLPDIPADLRQLMAEVGPRWRDSVAKNVDLMIERFSEVLKRSPRDGVTAHAGITYGDHERHAFDVFLPETMTTTTPVVLFAHGGAFVSGHRNRSEQIYSNVLYYLARHASLASTSATASPTTPPSRPPPRISPPWWHGRMNMPRTTAGIPRASS